MSNSLYLSDDYYDVFVINVPTLFHSEAVPSVSMLVNIFIVVLVALIVL